MLTPEQVAEMMNRGEMSPKGFALWLAAYDKEVRERAAQRVQDSLWPHIQTGMVSINAYRGAIAAAARGGEQA